MPVLRFSFVLLIFLILMSWSCVIATLGKVDENDAASSLTDAEGAVASAYRAVLEAEQAGANVSVLLSQLNEAGGNLTLAHYAYEQGDFDRAVDFANSSRIIGGDVRGTAIGLKDSALSEGVQRVWLAMTSSVVGVVGVSLGGFWVWHVFKRRYYGRVLGMKPEVISDES